MSAFVNCRACGGLHWGPYGAAGLVLTNPERTWVLLQLRSRGVQHGGTWGLLGGGRDAGETPTDAALREAVEEAGLDRAAITVLGELPGLDHDGWRYTYVRASASMLLPAYPNAETAALAWKRIERVEELPNLHPDLRRDWPDLRKALS